MGERTLLLAPPGIVSAGRRPPLPVAGGRIASMLDFFILDGILRSELVRYPYCPDPWW